MVEYLCSCGECLQILYINVGTTSILLWISYGDRLKLCRVGWHVRYSFDMSLEESKHFFSEF